MNVTVSDFVSGARAARGVAIVIDVFRACSVVAHALARGAARVVPVADVADARELKRAHPDWLLMGERHARKLPGFDAGNSPTELASLDVKDRTIVHTTHAGTQGLTAAASVADAVFTGAIVNLTATARAVRELAPREVSIVRMGHEARERCDEDDLCAELFCAAFEGGEKQLSSKAIAVRLQAAPAAAKFFDPAADWAPRGDFDACAQLDLFDFAVRWRRGAEGLGELTR
jgi:2-phosphosulfolactate phosphatase